MHNWKFSKLQFSLQISIYIFTDLSCNEMFIGLHLQFVLIEWGSSPIMEGWATFRSPFHRLHLRAFRVFWACRRNFLLRCSNLSECHRMPRTRFPVLRTRCTPNRCRCSRRVWSRCTSNRTSRHWNTAACTAAGSLVVAPVRQEGEALIVSTLGAAAGLPTSGPERMLAEQEAEEEAALEAAVVVVVLLQVLRPEFSLVLLRLHLAPRSLQVHHLLACFWLCSILHFSFIFDKFVTYCSAGPVATYLTAWSASWRIVLPVVVCAFLANASKVSIYNIKFADS